MLGWSDIRMAEWYYGENGTQVGPLDDHAMRSAIGEGRLHQQTLVWRDGMVNWLPLGNVPELAAPNLQSVPHAPPVPVYYGPTSSPMAGRASGMAVASMVCGIVTWVSCFVFLGLPAIAAIICGHLALSSINHSPVPVAGRGMAISGLVMGYLMILTIAGSIFALLIAGAFK
jgi:hypothetical protein